MKLSQCNPGQKLRVIKTQPDQLISQRLMELGFIQGAEVAILHEAPFSKDPIAVMVRGSRIALRKSEAQWIEVEVL